MADVLFELSNWWSQTTLPLALIDHTGQVVHYNPSFGDFFGTEASRSLKFEIQHPTFHSEVSALPTDMRGDRSYAASVFIKLEQKPGYALRIYVGHVDEFGRYLAVVEKLDENDTDFLRQALEEAQERDRLKTAFLANMSHEIRTPLNTIIGFSELIIEEKMPEDEIIKLVEMIKTSGQSLLKLIEDIIDISRIEAGQLRINKTELKALPVIEELFQIFDNELLKRRNKHEVKLRVGNIHPKDACVIADPYRFRQILTNLLSNAIKFTDKGYIEIGYVYIDQGVVQFYVKDTGMGIDPSMVNRLFQRFGQLQQAGMKNKSGAGLGLAITKQLVELQGGQIWFDSQPEKGTTFYFTLPACPRNIEHRGIYSPEMFQWGKEIFLIVDDVEANYLFLRSVLRNTGALLLWAKNGEEAIRYCRSNPDISLVLMDIQMPNTDGYEATRRIKEINPNLPVLAQTAFADNDSRIKAFEAGCDDFLAKPINKHELFSIINQYLRKRTT